MCFVSPAGVHRRFDVTHTIRPFAGPRANSTLYIYLSLLTLLKQDPPIPVFLSSNNVVLTPGNAEGVIPKELFSKVIRLRREVVQPVSVRSVAEDAAKGEGRPQSREDEIATELKPSKRDRKQRERPRFVQEVIWEDGVAVDPPRLVTQDTSE